MFKDQLFTSHMSNLSYDCSDVEVYTMCRYTVTSLDGMSQALPLSPYFLISSMLAAHLDTWRGEIK